VCAYAGTAGLVDRVNTNMCTFEFTATPAPSPKLMSGGSLKKLGTDSYGISGTDCCVNAVTFISIIAASAIFFTANLLQSRPEVYMHPVAVISHQLAVVSCQSQFMHRVEAPSLLRTTHN